MKKFTLSVVLSLFGMIAFGQIVKQGNSWNYVEIAYTTGVNCLKSTNCSGFATWNYQYDMGKDTLINDTIYKIVNLKVQTPYSSQPYIAGYMRADASGKKVYGRVNNINNSKLSPDQLLYDFTLQVNSTFGTMKVVAIDSVQKGGEKRLRLIFNQTQRNEQTHQLDSIAWVEGVGGNFGLFPDGEMHAPLLFLCFKQNSELGYINDYGLECDYGTVSIPSTTTTELTIFPNPAKDVVTIQNNQPIDNIHLYSLDGAELFHFSNLDVKYELNLRPLKSGIYVISVDGQFRKIVKK